MGAKREEKREEETGGSLVLPWERREKWVRERVKGRKEREEGRFCNFRKKGFGENKEEERKERTKRKSESCERKLEKTRV